MRSSLRLFVALAVIGFCGALGTASAPGATANPPHPYLRGLKLPLVVAHRGGAALRPENTLVAFRHAAELGADIIEMDLQVTADDVVVVLHDATVDRTTNGMGSVHSLALRDVQALDAAYEWTPDAGATFPYRGAGVTVPTLAEVLDALPAARLSVELKPEGSAFATRLCALIREKHAETRVLVASQDTAAVERFRAACPAVATGATADEAVRFVRSTIVPLVPDAHIPALMLLLPERYRGIPVLSGNVITGAHAQGVHVHAWTINEEADMRRLLALGVDGIVTDRPDRLRAILGRE
jgi:glycerophosphoryl diester phosphodiesterase